MSIDLSNIKFVYLLGIGGIGMSSLARYFKSEGKFVAGYDRTETTLTKELASEKISVHYDDRVDSIPVEITSASATELLVIYTPAIPKDSQELGYFLQKGMPLFKRAQVLGAITNHKFCFAVAGTHGKTTTSAMLSHILQQCGQNPQAFVGGIMTNYNTNVLLSKGSKICVVEADEFDRSFLQLSPDIAVITSMDADHLDIYQEHGNLLEAFSSFVDRINSNGKLVIQESISHEVSFEGEKISYGYSNDADYQIINIEVANGAMRFDIKTPQAEIWKGIELHLPGRHNVLNATAALICSYLGGLSVLDIKQAIASFKGVKRRFEYIFKSDSHIYIDDYAHHPTEIEACISAASQMHPNKKITVVFQPHLYTRTRDFAEGFSQSLSLADEVFLLDIYPARELPIAGVNSEMLLEGISSQMKKVIHKEELVNTIKERKNSIELLMTVGAGDIDKFVPELKHVFEN